MYLMYHVWCYYYYWLIHNYSLYYYLVINIYELTSKCMCETVNALSFERKGIERRQEKLIANAIWKWEITRERERESETMGGGNWSEFEANHIRCQELMSHHFPYVIGASRESRNYQQRQPRRRPHVHTSASHIPNNLVEERRNEQTDRQIEQTNGKKMSVYQRLPRVYLSERTLPTVKRSTSAVHQTDAISLLIALIMSVVYGPLVYNDHSN